MSRSLSRDLRVLAAPLLIVSLLSLVALEAACGPGEKAPATPQAGEPTASAPYSADELRESSRTGRRYEWNADVPGKPREVRVITFVRVNKGGAETENVTLDAAGHMVGEPIRGSATWQELRDHAAFPASHVAVTEETITVPAGTYPCKLYTVTDGAKVSRFWFANTMPGPPVKLVITEAGVAKETRELIRITNVE